MTETEKPLRNFTQVYLENWRNFAKVDAELQRRVFLVGPNAAGKSNLLDVFRFLHDLVAVGGGFQEAIRKRGGVSRLRSLVARRNPNVVVRVQIDGKGVASTWEYEIRFSQDSQRRPIITREQVRRNGRELLARPNPQDQADQERLTQTYLEQINVNKEFREIAVFSTPSAISMSSPSSSASRIDQLEGRTTLSAATSWSRSPARRRRPAPRGCDVSRTPSVSPCPSSRIWSCLETTAARRTFAASTGIGGLRARGRRRTSSRTEASPDGPSLGGARRVRASPLGGARALTPPRGRPLHPSDVRTHAAPIGPTGDGQHALR